MKFSIHLDFSVELNGRQLLTSDSRKRLQGIIKRRARLLCHYCGKYTPDGHIDHVIPLARGGTDDLKNLVWACADCNWSKGDKLLSEWEGPEHAAEETPVQTEVEKHYDILCAVWNTQNLTRRTFQALFRPGGTALWQRYVGGENGKPGIWEQMGAITKTGSRGSWEFCKRLEEIVELDPELQDYARNLYGG